MRPASLRSAADLAADKPHGTRVKYLGGCRCVPCRAANSRYSVECDWRRRNWEGNPLVPADLARQHILALAGQQVGRRAVAAASDTPESTISAIRDGRRLHVRRRTEERILAVGDQQRSDASLVPAAGMWRQIGELLAEGFTTAELARRLGYRNPVLQFRQDLVLAKTVLKVEKFYRAIMAGGEE